MKRTLTLRFEFSEKPHSVLRQLQRFVKSTEGTSAIQPPPATYSTGLPRGSVTSNDVVTTTSSTESPSNEMMAVSNTNASEIGIRCLRTPGDNFLFLRLNKFLQNGDAQTSKPDLGDLGDLVGVAHYGVSPDS